MAQVQYSTPGGNNNANATAVIRFDGTHEEQYEAWKFWATAWLRQKRKYGEGGEIANEEELTSSLITVIVPFSPAYDAIKHFKETELYTQGGYDRVWKALNERFPAKVDIDLKGEALDSVFRLRALPGEESLKYVGRARQVFSRCTALLIAFSGEIQGFIMLRATRMADEQQALCLSLAKGSWEVAAIAVAIRSAFPGKLPEPAKKNMWFTDDFPALPYAASPAAAAPAPAREGTARMLFQQPPPQ